MKDKIESGQLCTVEPIKEFEDLQQRDIARVQRERLGISAFDKSYQQRSVSDRQQSRAEKWLDFGKFDFREKY
jgi:hypothetical protein